MKKYLLAILFIMSLHSQLNAQGCVAIRSFGGFSTMDHAMHDGMLSEKDSSKWDLNVSFRYFKSYKHFNGTDEQTQRVIDETDVRNYSKSMDIVLVRQFNEQWSIGVDLPIVSNERSSLYEHLGNVKGNPRFTTSSQGIGDVRLSVYKWIIAPKPGSKGNLQGGIGIKMPTGNYRAKDIFHYSLTATREGPVDQSIQPGDGGWGISTELNGFRQLNNSWSIYGNAYYLMNPKGNNGVSTTRGGIASASAIKYSSDMMSVPDQYLVRTGANWTKNELTLSLGGRYECIPTFDLIGDNTGFRRPGRVITAEPGVNYRVKKINFYMYTPIALFRERNQSNADILKTIDTKTFSRGDAAFADYSINIGIGYKF